MPKMGLRNIFFSKTTPLPPPSRTFSDSLMDENIETARSLISKWDPNNSASAPLFRNTRQEAKQYLDAVVSLQTTMQYLVARDSSSLSLIQAQSLMQLAMNRLQMEFYRILTQNRDNLDPESVASTDRRSSSVSDDDDDFSEDDFRFAGDSVSTVAMADLKAIAECMVSAGYRKECVKVYILMRKSVVDEALYHLGVERLSFSQVQKMDWETLHSKIKCWLNAVKIAVRTLFHAEKTLCDYVFGSPERMIAESCFAAVCREGAASLFGFPENVARCKKTPEKMFRTLDMYEAMSENWNQIASIFSSEPTSSVRSQATASLVKLGEAVRTMLTDFESAIQKESSRIPVPGGGIHPLTRYVMNYIAFLADYRDALADIVAGWPQNPLPESYYRSPDREEKNRSSEIAERIAWLILVVLCKLDGKAELYKDVALSYLFLANNMQYVVVKVRKSNLGFILGEEWLTKHEAKVKEYVSKYERVGWSKAFPLLPENPTPEEARGIFESFNAAFHEACRVQSTWVVPDPNLREEIKASIGLKLVARYKEMCGKYRVGSETVSGFWSEDMEHYLGEILCGSGESRSVSWRGPSPPPIVAK
ncbi:exocyst complex component EXO70H1 [Cajanus cajan]|nr:exocyst complex component EXO70H1 [Cajanus cajan]